MKVTEELSVQIKARLNAFVGNPNNPQYLRDYAKQLQALPIYVDWAGLWAIRPDGEIILQHTEDDIKTEVEKDMRILNLVIFQGSKEYPELSVLIPSRTDDDLECPHCLGGTLPLNALNVVCYCGGLGWLPKDYQE